MSRPESEIVEHAKSTCHQNVVVEDRARDNR